mgnify:FL=1
MKYLAAIRNVLVLAAIVLLNPIAIAGHASANSTMHNAHSGSNRSTGSKSPACISLCATATLKDEEETKSVIEERDDEPQPPYYQLYRNLDSDRFIPKKLASSYVQKHLVFRPPDLVKLYSNYRF